MPSQRRSAMVEAAGGSCSAAGGRWSQTRNVDQRWSRLRGVLNRELWPRRFDSQRRSAMVEAAGRNRAKSTAFSEQLATSISDGRGCGANPVADPDPDVQKVLSQRRSAVEAAGPSYSASCARRLRLAVAQSQRRSAMVEAAGLPPAPIGGSPCRVANVDQRWSRLRDCLRHAAPLEH